MMSLSQHFQHLYNSLITTELAPWIQQLPELVAKGLNPKRYGDLPAWQRSIEQLPAITAEHIELRERVAIGAADEINAATRQGIETHLRELMPWRKGPLWVYGTHIDTEWRSDWKWERVLPHIKDLNDRLVLDVGCGNGYHCLRMLGQNARRVIGIDPSPRFVVQFYALKHFAPALAADVVPATLDDMPEHFPVFDTVFSMGVLYHRPSPMDHLRQLKAMLRPSGQLVLETLIVDGEAGRVLVPEGRYAMMNNVWFIPSAKTLVSWLRKCGFDNPRLVDSNRTGTDEQRTTGWMTFHSLADFLDPGDPTRTVEGHPAPLRGLFVAENPL